MRQNMLSISTEAVQYQGKSLFFQDLTLAIQQMKDENDITSNFLEVVGIDRIVFKHTGLLTTTEIANDGDMMFNACAYPPILDANAPFWNPHNDMGWSDYIESEKIGERKLKTYLDNLRATIDRRKGRVGGLFSKIPLKMFLGYQLVKELTAEQAAAIYLHEIGHLFTFFEILIDTVATNLAIGAASEALGKATTLNQKVEILFAYERITGRKLQDVRALAEAKVDSEGYGTILIREYVGAPTRSQADSFIYDLRGSEFAADHFASMHGAGKDLVMGLDALYVKFKVPVRQSFGAWCVLQALQVGALIVLALLPTLNPLNFLLNIGIYITVIGFFLNPYVNHDIYDEPKARVERVRNNLVQALKNLKLSQKDREALLKDIELVDNVSKDMVDRRQLFGILWTSLTPNRRKQYNQIKFQKELESVINNNLFVSAGKLNNLSTQGA